MSLDDQRRNLGITVTVESTQTVNLKKKEFSKRITRKNNSLFVSSQSLIDALVSFSFSFQDRIDLGAVPSSPSFGAYSRRIESLYDNSLTKPLCIMHMRDKFVDTNLSNLIRLVVSEVV